MKLLDMLQKLPFGLVVGTVREEYSLLMRQSDTDGP